MEQPQGFETGDDSVLKLLMALYGTRQGGRCWHKHFTRILISLGFSQCSYEPCLFYKVLDDGTFIIMALYVDDALAISPNRPALESLLKQIGDRLSISVLGFPKWFLGMRVSKDDSGRILLDQSRAISDILERFNLQSLNFIQVPLSPQTQLLPLDDSSSQTTQPYRSLIGSLMYMMTSTRPDLTVSVSMLGQFMANPGSKHWEAGKKVVRYLKGTSGLALCFDCTGDMITAFSDSDWAKDPSDRKSYSGYAVFVGKCLIAWKCKKQTSVALSTAEAEYMALALVVTEVIWLRNLLSDIGFPQNKPTTVFCDNNSAIHMANNDVIGPKTKHISIRHHFLRDMISDDSIVLEYVPTADNLADFMTKPLTGQKFHQFKKKLNLVNING